MSRIWKSEKFSEQKHNGILFLCKKSDVLVRKFCKGKQTQVKKC